MRDPRLDSTTAQHHLARISALLGSSAPTTQRLRALEELAQELGGSIIVRRGEAPGSAALQGAIDVRLARALREAANLLLRQAWRRERRELAMAAQAHQAALLEERIAQFEHTPHDAGEAITIALWHLPTGIVVVDGVTRRILYANKFAARLLGTHLAQVLGITWDEAFASLGTDQLQRIAGHFRATSRVQTVVRLEGVEPVLRYLAIDAARVEAAPRLIRVLLWDASDAAIETTWVEWAAAHDPLTGLLNRNGLAAELARRRTSSRPGLVWVDVAGVAAINQTLGQRVGDEVLRAVADAIVAELGPDDLAARVGGDEFAVLTADPNAASHLRRQLSGTLHEEPLSVAGVEVAITLRSASTSHPHGSARADTGDTRWIWEELSRLERAARQAPPRARRRRRGDDASRARTALAEVATRRLVGYVDVTSGEVAGHELVLVDALGNDLRQAARRDHAATHYDEALAAHARTASEVSRYLAVRPLEPTPRLLASLAKLQSRAQLTLELDDLASPTAKVQMAPLAREARARGVRIGLDLGFEHGGELQAIAHLAPDQILIPLHEPAQRRTTPLEPSAWRLIEGLAALAVATGAELAATRVSADDLTVLRSIALDTGARILASAPDASTTRS